MAQTPEEKKAHEKATREAEKARRAALTPEERAAEDVAKAEAKAEKPGQSPITVTYLDHAGQPATRVFSPEDHGADFVKFAEEFKKTNAARIVKDAPAAEAPAPADAPAA